MKKDKTVKKDKTPQNGWSEERRRRHGEKMRAVHARKKSQPPPATDVLDPVSAVVSALAPLPKSKRRLVLKLLWELCE